MKSSLIVLVTVSMCFLSSVILVDATDACKGQDYGTAGQFDYYVYEQSWPAAFCSDHSDWPGCSNPTDWQQANFTLHGMWPNYLVSQGSHDWPQCCKSVYNTTVNPAVISKLLTQLQQYWPNEQDPNPLNDGNLSTSLWEHEWNKHGTCSGLPQLTYFQAAMRLEAANPTPSLITTNIGGSVNFTDLMNYYSATSDDCLNGDDCIVGLLCDEDNNLTGLTTCYDKKQNQIICPSQSLDNLCSNSSLIGIQSF